MMAPPCFVVWKWHSPFYRTAYEAEHVNVFAGMLRRHHRAPHRLVCVTDDPTGIACETYPLWDDFRDMANPSGLNLPSCYRRLKIFAGKTTRAMGIADGDRVVSVDLDTVITGDIVPLFERDEDFVGWKGVGNYQPVVYNGSLFMHRAGRMERLWTEFDPVRSPLLTREAKYFGSDQAWMSYSIAGSAPGWDVPDGVYSYSRDVRGKGYLGPSGSPTYGPLPEAARIVFFNGKHKPWEPHVQADSPWIADHWRP